MAQKEGGPAAASDRDGAAIRAPGDASGLSFSGRSENVQADCLLGAAMRYVERGAPGERTLRLTRAGRWLGVLVRQGRLRRDDAVTTVALVGLVLEVFDWTRRGQRAALVHAEASVGGAS